MTLQEQIDEQTLRLNDTVLRVGNLESIAPPILDTAPVLTGKSQVGQTLTGSDGTWKGSPEGWTYQWYLDGTPITGAIGATSPIWGAGDVGKVPGFGATAHNDFGTGFKLVSGSAIIAATTYETETNAYLAALTTAPSTAAQNAIDAFVKALKSGASSLTNILAKGGIFYIPKLQTEQAGLVNLFDPTKIGTKNGGVTFTPGSGFKGTGVVGDYVGTGINHNAVPNIARDSESIVCAVYDQGVRSSSNWAIGLAGTSNISMGFGLINASAISQRINTTVNGSVAIDSSGAGRWIVNRNSGGAVTAYKNGVAVAGGSFASTVALAAAEVRLFNMGGSYGTEGVSAWGLFGGLSAAESADVDAALATLLAAL